MIGNEVRDVDRGGGALEATEIHDVLRNDRRRLVLERLRKTDTSESVSDLSEYVASVETGESPAPRNARQSAYVALHQTHLPKLDELGIVVYDSDAKEVSLARNAAEVAVYMEVVPRYAISWAELYFGLGLLGLLTLVGVASGVPLLADVPPAALGGVSLALVTAVAAYQLVTQRRSLLHRLSRGVEPNSTTEG